MVDYNLLFEIEKSIENLSLQQAFDLMKCNNSVDRLEWDESDDWFDVIWGDVIFTIAQSRKNNKLFIWDIRIYDTSIDYETYVTYVDLEDMLNC